MASNVRRITTTDASSVPVQICPPSSGDRTGMRITTFSTANTLRLYLGSTADAFTSTDLATNGTFTSTTGWLGSSDTWAWSTGDGTVSHASGSTKSFRQTVTGIKKGLMYEVTFELSSVSKNGVAPRVGGTAGKEVGSSVSTGTFTDYIVAGANNLLEIVPNTSFVGKIDNVTLRETGHWALMSTGNPSVDLNVFSGRVWKGEVTGIWTSSLAGTAIAVETE